MKVKTKTCKACHAQFTPARPLQVACSLDCAIKHSEAIKAKEKAATVKTERAGIRKAREKVKTRGDWMREAQTAFNAYIRERDKDWPCISCGRFHTGQYQAGHYRTTKAAPELRFNELNVHKQCSACNNHLAGNIVEYRINLIRKIGNAKVEWLEGKHDPAKWTIDQLQGIKKAYKLKLKELTSKGE